MMKKELVSVVICVGQRHDRFRQLMDDYDAALRKDFKKLEYVIVIDGEYPDVVDDINAFGRGRSNIRIVQLSRTWLYHKIIRLVTGYTFRDIGCCARVIRRQVADEVVLYGDQNAFLPILACHRGFKVVERSIPQSDQDPYLRYYGPSVYARRFLDIFTVFFITRFTKAPLRFFGVVGSLFLAAGMALAGFVVAQRLLFDIAAAGRPALLFGVVFVVLGVQLFAIGLIGELVIFTHGRELKEYTVAKVVRRNDLGAGPGSSSGAAGGVSRRQADAN